MVILHYHVQCGPALILEIILNALEVLSTYALFALGVSNIMKPKLFSPGCIPSLQRSERSQRPQRSERTGESTVPGQSKPRMVVGLQSGTSVQSGPFSPVRLSG